MNELQKLKIEQLQIDDVFNGQEPEQYECFLSAYFREDDDEINDVLKWRQEDKEYFTHKFKELLKLIESSEVEE
jgi:hypothetical protein